MRHELASYLRSVKSLYPNGLRRAAPGDVTSSHVNNQVASNPVTKPTREYRVAFFWLDALMEKPGSEWSDDLGVFLKSAVIKGLKCAESDVILFRGPTDILKLAAGTISASVHVALGADTSAIVAPANEKSPSVATISVSEASSSPEAKRKFWSELRQVLALLPVRN